MNWAELELELRSASWLQMQRRQITTRPSRGTILTNVSSAIVVNSVRPNYICMTGPSWLSATLQWRHNGRDSVSNHQPHDCLLNRLFGRRSKKTSKPRVTGLCAGISPGTGEFPAQRASYAENVSIRWRHHETICFQGFVCKMPGPRFIRAPTMVERDREADNPRCLCQPRVCLLVVTILLLLGLSIDCRLYCCNLPSKHLHKACYIFH